MNSHSNTLAVKSRQSKPKSLNFRSLKPVEADSDQDECDNKKTVSPFYREGDDWVGSYLKQIGKIPLLTADEEIELGRLVQKAIAIESEARTKDKPLTDEEMAHISRGNQAKKRMVLSNLLLVVSIAKKYQNRGIPFLDLIQEGSAGLQKGAEKFDPEKGYKFSTYATWWIRQAITRSIANQARIIRLPVHVIEKHNKINAAARAIKIANRNCSIETIAEHLDMEPEQVRDILLSVNKGILSLNCPVGNNDKSELGDLIADQSIPIQMQYVCLEEQKDLVQYLISQLSDNEQEIIRLKYGLDGSDGLTAREIAQLLNIPEAKVKLEINRAHRKMRANFQVRQLAHDLLN